MGKTGGRGRKGKREGEWEAKKVEKKKGERHLLPGEAKKMVVVCERWDVLWRKFKR